MKVVDLAVRAASVVGLTAVSKAGDLVACVPDRILSLGVRQDPWATL